MDDRTVLMSAKPLEPGYQLTWFTIRQVLGLGGFGITYLAYDNNLDREVAIKEYLPSSFAHRHQDDSVKPLTGDHGDYYTWGLDSFLKEAKTLAKFNHPNIVRVHSVFEQNNTAYMVMEYEHGENLASMIEQQGSLGQATLERLIFPVLDGLEKIHELGFVHRDIKPANIYVRKNGVPVLIDFGSARHTSQQHTGDITTLVSQGYTPLEQYSPDYGDQGPWTDVYSLAATIYQGITGAKPADAVSRSARMLRSKPDNVERLQTADYPDYQQSFLDAVHAGLALQPDSRPQKLGDWIALFTAASTPTTAPTRLPPGAQRVPGAKQADSDDTWLQGIETEDDWNTADVAQPGQHTIRPAARKKSGVLLALLSALVLLIVGLGAYMYSQKPGSHSGQLVESVAVDKPKPDSLVPESSPVVSGTSDSVQQYHQQVYFDQPLFTDTQVDSPRSISQIILSSPVYPPVEGLGEEYWADKECSQCHDWSRSNLCTQGKFYTGDEDNRVSRTRHPFGGFFKTALKQWAEGGCL